MVVLNTLQIFLDNPLTLPPAVRAAKEFDVWGFDIALEPSKNALVADYIVLASHTAAWLLKTAPANWHFGRVGLAKQLGLRGQKGTSAGVM